MAPSAAVIWRAPSRPYRQPSVIMYDRCTYPHGWSEAHERDRSPRAWPQSEQGSRRAGGGPPAEVEDQILAPAPEFVAGRAEAEADLREGRTVPLSKLLSELGEE